MPWNWLAKGFRATRKCIQIKKRVSSSWNCCPTLLDVQQLEDRIAPIVGANNPPEIQPRNSPYSGVALLTLTLPDGRNDFGSGALFRTEQGQGFGHHVLTVAHAITGQDATVGFFLARGTQGVDMAINVPQGNQFQLPHPNYRPRDDATGAVASNDIAIFRLTDQEQGFQDPSRLLVAPFAAQQYELYNQDNEIGRVFTIAGYGFTGTGNTGRVFDIETIGALRAGQNRFDSEGSILRNEVQQVFANGAGNFRLVFNGQQSAQLQAGSTAAQVQQALQAIDALRNNVRVGTVAGMPGV